MSPWICSSKRALGFQYAINSINLSKRLLKMNVIFFLSKENKRGKATSKADKVFCLQIQQSQFPDKHTQMQETNIKRVNGNDRCI